MQRLCVTGRVIKNPELKYTETGKVYAILPIAINDVGSITTYINFITYSNQAINASSYLTKGNLVYIDGTIKNSNKIIDSKMKYQYKFYANYIEYLDRKD